MYSVKCTEKDRVVTEEVVKEQCSLRSVEWIFLAFYFDTDSFP